MSGVITQCIVTIVGIPRFVHPGNTTAVLLCKVEV